MDQSDRCKGPGGAGGQHVSLRVLVIACAVFDLAYIIVPLQHQQ